LTSGAASGSRPITLRTSTRRSARRASSSAQAHFPTIANGNNDFASLSPQLIDDLYHHGVRLIGIDTPSVDPFDSKALEAHQAFARNDMAMLEGLVLDGVDEGEYELIALPLRISGADASPVRAVLRTL
jgi:arylformamidase